MGLGGGVGSKQTLRLATGYDVPGLDDFRLYDIEATLHMVTADVGWIWVLADHLSITASVGFTSTVDSKAVVKDKLGLTEVGEAGQFVGPGLTGGVDIGQLATFSSDSEQYLEEQTKKIHAPLVSVYGMYRF